jgi:hypothetical protein
MDYLHHTENYTSGTLVTTTHKTLTQVIHHLCPLETIIDRRRGITPSIPLGFYKFIIVIIFCWFSVGSPNTSVRLRSAVQIIEDHVDHVLSLVIEDNINIVIFPIHGDHGVIVIPLIQRDNGANALSLVPQGETLSTMENQEIPQTLTIFPLEALPPLSIRTHIIHLNR